MHVCLSTESYNTLQINIAFSLVAVTNETSGTEDELHIEVGQNKKKNTPVLSIYGKIELSRNLYFPKLCAETDHI
jgi:hypothetical protein